MIILGIETSCDETALSLLEVTEKNNERTYKVLNNAVLSQVKIHEQYGGVFPMMAKREHAKNLVPLLYSVLSESQFLIKDISNNNEEHQKVISDILAAKEPELLKAFLAHPELFNAPKIDAIAVTQGPGLEPALWVGINFAKALSQVWNIPLIPVNHMEGHITASLLKDSSYQASHTLHSIEFPALALLISGGHTEFVLMHSFGTYEIIGKTRDDAVGEAFDKVARLLGLPYPGGPEISNLAAKERIEFPESRGNYPLPRPMIHSGTADVSFSGLKTAVLYTLKKIPDLTSDIKRQIAREFEDAVVEVLISKTNHVLDNYNISTLIIGGGVIANKRIRAAFTTLAEERTIPLLLPATNLSTDNALMIAIAGSFKTADMANAHIIANGNMALGERSH